MGFGRSPGACLLNIGSGVYTNEAQAH